MDREGNLAHAVTPRREDLHDANEGIGNERSGNERGRRYGRFRVGPHASIARRMAEPIDPRRAIETQKQLRELGFMFDAKASNTGLCGSVGRRLSSPVLRSGGTGNVGLLGMAQFHWCPPAL